MTHDIKKNKYDVEIVDEKVLEDKHIIRIRTFVNGDEKIKQFNFSHDQTPGGERESWKKHIRQWIDRLEQKDKKCKACDEKGTKKFNVGK